MKNMEKKLLNPEQLTIGRMFITLVLSVAAGTWAVASEHARLNDVEGEINSLKITIQAQNAELKQGIQTQNAELMRFEDVVRNDIREIRQVTTRSYEILSNKK